MKINLGARGNDDNKNVEASRAFLLSNSCPCPCPCAEVDPEPIPIRIPVPVPVLV